MDGQLMKNDDRHECLSAPADLMALALKEDPMSLETIQQGYDEADADDAPVNEIEAASDAFRTSQDMADIIASLDDCTDEQIGAMVRAGFRKQLQKVSHMRRMKAAFSGGEYSDCH